MEVRGEGDTESGTGPKYTDRTDNLHCRAQELCESRGGRPGFPSLISLRFFVDVKQHSINNRFLFKQNT